MIQQKLQEDLRAAQLSKDEISLSTLRMLLSELRYAQIRKRDGKPSSPGASRDGNSELSDDEAIAIIQREIKKRREAAEGFRRGGREEQAGKEEAEAQILSAYLPAQLPDEELARIVEQAIGELGASSMTDMGRVTGAVRAKVGNQADGARISEVVKRKLT